MKYFRDTLTRLQENGPARVAANTAVEPPPLELLQHNLLTAFITANSNRLMLLQDQHNHGREHNST